MNFCDTFVKLLPNCLVKSLLEHAKINGQAIEVSESYFLVRDKQSVDLTFRGIKIRENVWGITFCKKYWLNDSQENKILPRGRQTT